MAEFIQPKPVEDGARAGYLAADVALDRLFEVYRRAMGRIARACMRVEDALDVGAAEETRAAA